MGKSGTASGRRTYPDRDRSSLIAAFEVQRAKGALASEAASKVGVPLSTIFRWKSNEKEKRLRQDLDEQGRRVSKALSDLYDGPSARSDEAYLESLFVFIGWLRCSGKPELLDISVATLLVAVAKARFGAKTLDGLPSRWLNIIATHINLANFLEFCCINMGDDSLVEFPTFFNDPLDDQPYDDRDELARICWCLLALGGSNINRASLGKAIYLISKNNFKYQWRVSRRTKEKFWHLHAAASPFMFVERFHSPLELSLDPEDPEFLQKIDDLVVNHAAMKRFCHDARAVVDQLVRTMDPRALEAIHFPAFPDKITPSKLRMPELTSSMISSLQGYNSAER